MDNLTSNNFTESTRNGIHIVEFSGENCGACKTMEGLLKQWEPEFNKNGVEIHKVDCESNMQLVNQFHIRSLPSIFILSDMAVVSQFIGVTDKTSILNSIKQ